MKTWICYYNVDRADFYCVEFDESTHQPQLESVVAIARVQGLDNSEVYGVKHLKRFEFVTDDDNNFLDFK